MTLSTSRAVGMPGMAAILLPASVLLAGCGAGSAGAVPELPGYEPEERVVKSWTSHDGFDTPIEPIHEQGRYLSIYAACTGGGEIEITSDGVGHDITGWVSCDGKLHNSLVITAGEPTGSPHVDDGPYRLTRKVSGSVTAWAIHLVQVDGPIQPAVPSDQG